MQVSQGSRKPDSVEFWCVVTVDGGGGFESRTKAYQCSNRSQLPMKNFAWWNRNEGVELRLRCANKGNAVRRLVEYVQPDVSIAYLGDNLSTRTLSGFAMAGD
jgi:trehalose-6-phosphatase